MASINDFQASYEQHRRVRLTVAAANKATIFAALQAANIARVSVVFEGEGDEGQIGDKHVVARTQAEIQGSMNSELTSGTGLIGRWALNEGAGTVAQNCVATRPNGTLTNGPTWTAGATITAATPGAPTVLNKSGLPKQGLRII